MSDFIQQIKAKRKAELDATASVQKAENDALIASLMKQVQDHAGSDVSGHFVVKLLSAHPPILELTAKDHIPIEVKFSPLSFHVLRFHGKKSHDRLDDALLYGAPLKPEKNVDPVPFVFDTAPKKSVDGT